MFPRYTASHAQSPLHIKAARFARKHSRLSTVAATAVAAAGIGAVGASAGTTTLTAAVGNLAMAGHTGSASAAGHAAAAVFGSAIEQMAVTPSPQSAVELAATHEVPAPGIAGALANDAVAAFKAAMTSRHAPSTSTAPNTAPQPASAQPAHPAPSAPAPAKPAVAHAAPAPAHAAPAHAAPAHAAPAHAAPAPARPAPAHRPPAHPARPAPVHPRPAPPVKPYLIYDSVTPTAIPSHKTIATYSNGAYAASASAVSGRGHVLWIDTNGSNPRADALDVEPGDATPAGAAAWVKTKLSTDHNHVAIVYTMISQWQAVKDNMAGLPHWMQDKVRYWIADPTGVDHVLPGSNATQWYWGNSYDITTAHPGFWS